MKPILSALLLLLACSLASAQPWMAAPYLDIRNASDEWKRTNFYEIQEAFERYEEAREAMLEDPEAREAEGEEEEYECDGEFPGFAQYKRWEAYMEPRVYPSGDITLPQKTYDHLQQYLRSSYYLNAAINKESQALVVSSWIPLGPWGTHWKSYFGGAGRVTFLKFHPTNPNTMWTFAPSGGLWKTVDGGLNWTTNTDQLPFIGTTDMAINPLNPNEMYLAMGDGNGTNSSLWQRSVGIGNRDVTQQLLCFVPPIRGNHCPLFFQEL